MIRIRLSLMPLPLSKCFKNVALRGRGRTGEYQAWCRYADGEMIALNRHAVGKSAASPCILGRVRVLIDIAHCEGDVDNRLKCLCDLLTRNHVISDDKMIDDLRIVRAPPHAEAVYFPNEPIRVQTTIAVEGLTA